jgi:hypothetical protein
MTPWLQCVPHRFEGLCHGNSIEAIPTSFSRRTNLRAP